LNTHAENEQENKSESFANEPTQSEGTTEATFQFVDNRPESIQTQQLQELANNSAQVSGIAQLQAMADSFTTQKQPIQRKENKTGLPDNLKTGMENLSGMSLDDVKVHRNSDKPAQLQAHAFAQGTDIHLASGQEKHLPHEAWHVVQQKQGRVKPTMQMKGKVNVNDDRGLEKEADVMGARALSISVLNERNTLQRKATNNSILQRLEFGKDFKKNHQMSSTDFNNNTKVAERLFERGISKSTVVLASNMVDGTANQNPGTGSSGYHFRYIPNVETREASNDGTNIKVVDGSKPYLEGYRDGSSEKITHLHGMDIRGSTETSIAKSNFDNPDALSSQVANIIFNSWTARIEQVEKYNKGLGDIQGITAELAKLNALDIDNIASEAEYTGKVLAVRTQAKSKLENMIEEKTEDFLSQLKVLTYYLLCYGMENFEYDNDGANQLEEIDDSFKNPNDREEYYYAKDMLQSDITILDGLSVELQKVKDDDDAFNGYLEAILGIKGVIAKLPETIDEGEE
jgi:hypothetical protein